MIDIEQMNVSNPKYEPIAFGFRHEESIVEVF